MVNCVLISEEEDCITDIDIDIKSDDLYRVLKGTGTFIGQLPDTEIVIMKCDKSYFELIENRNRLPEPFHEEIVLGPILLILMDSEANPQDYTVSTFLDRHPRVTV